jgi:hypothetical protein
MTVLGKILVIVNFVFSLVTAALIIMVFVTRTNWKASYDDLAKKYQAARASNDAYVKEVENQKNTIIALEGAAKKARDELAAANATADQKVQALQGDLAKVTARAQNSETTLAAATEELKRRELEVTNLKTVMAGKDEKLNDLEAKNKDFRDKAVAQEINANSEHDRNRLMAATLEQQAKEIERLRATKGVAGGSGANGATALKPPPQDVKGTIRAHDPQSGLVTISIGSDSGLQVGNTLEVYRLDGKAEYLGRIRVVDVDFKQSVARTIAPLRADRLKDGDIVASRIVVPR